MALTRILLIELISLFQVGKLLSDLVRLHLLLPSQFQKGLCSLLEFAADMELDVPKIWAYMGEIIGEILLSFIW